MDPINLLLGINLVSTFIMGVSVAKQGIRQKVSTVQERPNSFLQKYPPNLAAILILVVIAGLFGAGTFSSGSYIVEKTLTLFGLNNVENSVIYFRTGGLVLYILASWLQIKSVKDLGKNYSQDMVILKKHELVKKGTFKLIRHPQYLFQILMDLGAGIALLSYIIIPVVVLIELPLLILRASAEEKLLQKYFSDEFINYKKESGFFIPFLG